MSLYPYRFLCLRKEMASQTRVPNKYPPYRNKIIYSGQHDVWCKETKHVFFSLFDGADSDNDICF